MLTQLAIYSQPLAAIKLCAGLMWLRCVVVAKVGVDAAMCQLDIPVGCDPSWLSAPDADIPLDLAMSSGQLNTATLSMINC